MNSVRTVLQMASGFLMVAGGIMYFTIPAAHRHLPLIDALKATGYLWEWIAVVNIIAGLALMLGRFVSFALIVFAPISLNILLIHFANPGAGGIATWPGRDRIAFRHRLSYRLEFRPRFTVDPTLKFDRRPIRNLNAGLRLAA
jgi:putative oxidoreductase